MANPTEESQLINFEAHARTTTVAKSPATEVLLEISFGYFETCRQAFDDDRERLTMRFACSEETEHTTNLVVALKWSFSEGPQMA